MSTIRLQPARMVVNGVNPSLPGPDAPLSLPDYPVRGRRLEHQRGWHSRSGHGTLPEFLREAVPWGGGRDSCRPCAKAQRPAALVRPDITVARLGLPPLTVDPQPAGPE